MAIFCLATCVSDLKRRLGQIIIGETRKGAECDTSSLQIFSLLFVSGESVTANDLQASGAMTALLRDALKPNLVQTLGGNPAIIHGGPFANIAHGCSSVLATTMAQSLADIVVTEGGFGADLVSCPFLLPVFLDFYHRSLCLGGREIF